jgi:hypothetical protein
MKKLLIAALLAVIVAIPTKVSADLILAGDIDSGTLFCATDNNTVCNYGVQLFDTNLAVGVLSLNSTLIGGLQVEGSLHTATDDGTTNILSSSSLSIINTTLAAVTLAASIGATDFTGPATEGFTTGSGTWVSSPGSSTTYTWWNDPNNAQGGETATDREGNLIDSFSDIAGSQTLDSFSHNGGPFALGDIGPLFSMTLGFDMILLGGDSLISRGQSEIADVDVAAIPEPGSILLLGSGLLAVARKVRNKKKPIVIA